MASLDINDLLKKRACVNEGWIKTRTKEIQSVNLKGEQLAAWLLRAVTMIDLTTLGGDDSECNVVRLCVKAQNPLSDYVVTQLLGLKNNGEARNITTGAVCVYPAMVPHAFKQIIKDIPIASVAAGFPTGLYPLETRLKEIELTVAAGASEIDIVIERHLVITHNWQKLYEDLKKMRQACGRAHMKSILAVGELGSYDNIYCASMVAMAAGSNFIKTSTGKEAVNATIPFGLVMCRAIRDYYVITNRKVGLKPAGGLRTPNDAIAWMIMVHEELGKEWLNPKLFRIGASGLLGSIERVLTEMAHQQKESPNIPVAAI